MLWRKYAASDYSSPHLQTGVSRRGFDELMDEAANLAAELGLRGADSIYVAVARQLNLPFVSFDVDQRQRAQGQVAFQSIK
jgi:predicted nucleic acid-binding protein